MLREGLASSGPARVGVVCGELPGVPPELSEFASRSSCLLLAALNEIQSDVDAAISRYGKHRIGIVLGTSTSGIDEGERAVAEQLATGHLPGGYRYAQQELGTPSRFLARYLDLAGPAYCVSTLAPRIPRQCSR